MAVSVTGPRAVNELGGPVIPGSNHMHSAGQWSSNFASQLAVHIALASGHLISPVD